MAKNKSFTVEAMKKEHAKEFNERKQVWIDNYTFLVDKKFRPSKIAELLKELVSKLDYCRANGVNLDALDFTGYCALLMVKYFTNINIPESFEDQINVLEVMVDKHYLERIAESFDEDEVLKVNDMVEKMSNNIVDFSEKLKEVEFENSDLGE